ncbi:TRAP transporter large permease [uncultured Albimonas sp.]|uniref:TRAP transporter large permease n=1 Tax=uncultured Albimonas sp. TaxID=1331701 RepID=UPI0030ED9F50
MDIGTIGLYGFCAAFLLLALRVPIAFTLVAVATACTLVAYSWRPGAEFDLDRGFGPALGLVQSNAYKFLHSYDLSMVPMFILAGHLAFHSEVTTRIYFAVRIWLSRVPGGLAVASLIGCGGFSAITGSSMACASSMGKICVPEMLKYRYSPQLATASVAVGGTLGALIPPSVLFIIYGLFTETSVSRLFLAGVLPGLLSLVGFIVTVLIWVTLRPDVAPKVEETIGKRERFEALLRAWPAFVLIGTIIGGIYGGVFTATEVAAISVAFMLTYGLVWRTLTLRVIFQALKDTASQTAALFLIAVGAKIFVSFVSLSGVTRDFADFISHNGFSDWTILLAIVVLFLIMGMFLDPLGTMLLTLPFLIPLVEGMGMDLIWFGVVVVKLLEIGLITPPVGLNVFVINSVVTREIKVHTIFLGVVKFLVADLIVLALLIAFPIISLLLPTSMF